MSVDYPLRYLLQWTRWLQHSTKRQRMANRVTQAEARDFLRSLARLAAGWAREDYRKWQMATF